MFHPVHSFDISLKEAKRIQAELSKRVEISDAITNIDEIELVGGVDVAFLESIPKPSRAQKTEKNRSPENSTFPETTLPEKSTQEKYVKALAGVVILDMKRGCVVETACTTAPVFLPYIPGFLSFREGPAVLAVIRELSMLPEVMIYDGCGIAHPRGFGLASHMAIFTGLPSIGCAKSRLFGICDEPDQTKGSWTAITHNGKRIGVCLRTRKNVRPVYVSPGSGFSIDTARELVLMLAWKYRLPEPTRLAHNLVTARKRAYLSNI